MKIAAGIIGILSGIFGVIGGFLQTGAGVIVDDSMAENGAKAFWVSWLIIILSSIVLAKPKLPGLLLLIVGGAAFSYGNYFSAPFAIVAGLIAILSPIQKSESNDNLSGHSKNTNLSNEEKIRLYEEKYRKSK